MTYLLACNLVVSLCMQIIQDLTVHGIQLPASNSWLTLVWMRLLSGWARDNNLILHPEKMSAVLLICRQSREKEISDTFTLISQVRLSPDQGIVILRSLGSWLTFMEQAYQSLCSKAYGTLRCFRLLETALPKDIRASSFCVREISPLVGVLPCGMGLSNSKAKVKDWQSI